MERFHGWLAQRISMYVCNNQKVCDMHLHVNAVPFVYRVSPSDVTGESPSYTLYGR